MLKRRLATTNPKKARWLQAAGEGLSAAVVVGALVDTLQLELTANQIALMTWLAANFLHLSVPDVPDWARDK